MESREEMRLSKRWSGSDLKRVIMGGSERVLSI